MGNENNAEQQKKHSGLGIASLVIAILAGGFELITIIIAGILETASPTGIRADSLTAMLIGIAMFMGMGLSCFGLGLAVGGWVDKSRKRIFATVGFIANCVDIMGTLGLILLGLVAA